MFISDLVKNKNAHYIDFISDEVFIEYNYVLSILIETNQTVDEGVLKNGFLEVLFQNLFEILHKSMIVYLNELEIPSNKYIHTIIRDKKTKFIFFNKHKLLYSDCIKLIKNWGENTILTYNNIYCSLDLICKYFKYDREVKIETIQSNYGDLHNGNKCVLKINFNNEKSLYYKPRSGEQEIFYNKLLAKLDSDLKQNFKKLKILSFGCFHFVESIEYKECNTTEEVENFYIKIGIHLFLLYIMNSCDIHYENIICSGEDPVLIDLDTLVNPINVYDIFPFKNESNKLITKLVQISVMQSQLLGVFTIRDDSKVNLGGLSGVEDVFEKSFIIEGTTKPVRKEISKKVESSNLPIFNGKKIYPKEYEKHIIYGFKTVYNYFSNNEGNIKKFILSNLSKLKIRVLLRNTEEYGKAISDISYPTNIWDSTNRVKLLKQFRNDPIYNKLLKVVFSDECIQLLNYDIPYFYTYLNSKNLHSNNKIYHNFFNKKNIAIVKDKIDSLGMEDLDFQIKIIKELLTKNNLVTNSEDNSKQKVRKFDLNQKISDIFNIIIENSISEQNSIGWFSTFDEKERMMQIYPISPFIYSGLGGLLYLFQEYTKSEDLKFASIKEKIFSSYFERIYLNNVTVNFFRPETGIFNGGITEYLFMLDKMKDSNIGKIDWFIKKIKYLILVYDEIKLQNDIGLLNGLCGDIMCFTKIRSHSLNLDIVDQILHKIYSKVKFEINIAINSNSLKIGFAHGAAGIAYAFSNLINLNIIDNSELLHEIKKLVKYENTFFDNSNGSWSLDSSYSYHEGWCNGTPGIIFSRALIYNLTKDEDYSIDVLRGINYFINNCFNKNDCLCHGDSGNILIAQKLYQLNFLQKCDFEILKNNFYFSVSKKNFNPGYEYSFLPVELFTGIGGLCYTLINLSLNKSESILEFK